MPAGTHNITIEEGATFTMQVVWTDSAGAAIDLTGYSARMQVRKTKAATTTLLDGDSTGGEIVITAGTGTLDITFSATDTAALTGEYGVYDIEVESGSGVVTRLLEGEVTISREVTR